MFCCHPILKCFAFEDLAHFLLWDEINHSILKCSAVTDLAYPTLGWNKTLDTIGFLIFCYKSLSTSGTMWHVVFDDRNIYNHNVKYNHSISNHDVLLAVRGKGLQQSKESDKGVHIPRESGSGAVPSDPWLKTTQILSKILILSKQTSGRATHHRSNSLLSRGNINLNFFYVP